eukprot:scaffold840_cov344-Pavlova_lutheri.AAC.84
MYSVVDFPGLDPGSSATWVMCTYSSSAIGTVSSSSLPLCSSLMGSRTTDLASTRTPFLPTPSWVSVRFRSHASSYARPGPSSTSHAPQNIVASPADAISRGSSADVASKCAAAAFLSHHLPGSLGLNSDLTLPSGREEQGGRPGQGRRPGAWIERPRGEEVDGVKRS